MPGIAALAAARILERVILQSLGGNADARTPREETGAVRGHEMGHPSPEPNVPMQPETAVHRVDHSVAASGELHPLALQCVHIPRRRDRRDTEPLR